MNEVEQQLWAKVYAAEYDRLSRRAAVCFKPDPEADWDLGCSIPSRRCEELAVKAADRAVTLFKKRTDIFTTVPL